MGKKISKKRVYEIDNINVTEFITGHLSYRFNMKTIARLIGIKDEWITQKGTKSDFNFKW